MAIDRMPRVGDRMILSEKDTKIYVITGHKGGDSAICWALPEGETDPKKATCFIAWFQDPRPDGMFNQLVSFAPKKDA